MAATTIVVPCYNESKRFPVATFNEFITRHPEIHWLFINDGSTDDTLAVLTTLQQKHPQHAAVFNLSRNCGKAEAVRQGVVAASRGTPQYIGFWDADLSTPLEAIPEFCRVLDRREDINLVVGSRIPLLGRKIDRHPTRQLIGRCFARVVSSLFRLSIRDTQCGAKLFRQSPATRVAFRKPFLSRWIFDVEILVRMSRFYRNTQSVKNTVYEFPLDQWREVAGSKLTSWDFVRALRELIQIYSIYVLGFRPRPRVAARSETAVISQLAQPGPDPSLRRAA